VATTVVKDLIIVDTQDVERIVEKLLKFEQSHLTSDGENENPEFIFTCEEVVIKKI